MDCRIDCTVVHSEVNARACRAFRRSPTGVVTRTTALPDGSFLVASPPYFTLRFELPVLSPPKPPTKRKLSLSSSSSTAAAATVRTSSACITEFVGKNPKFYPVVTRSDYDVGVSGAVVVNVTCVDWTGFSVDISIPHQVIRRTRRDFTVERSTSGGRASES